MNILTVCSSGGMLPPVSWKKSENTWRQLDGTTVLVPTSISLRLKNCSEFLTQCIGIFFNHRLDHSKVVVSSLNWRMDGLGLTLLIPTASSCSTSKGMLFIKKIMDSRLVKLFIKKNLIFNISNSKKHILNKKDDRSWCL